MRRFIVLLMVLCLVWASPVQAEDIRTVASVAVMPFVKLKGEKSVWLDKAIADLVAQKLTESDSYAVLNRDALQTFIKEMQLQQSGFVADASNFVRVGKVARVGEVIYGNYAVDGARIDIHLTAMDIASQKIVAQKDVHGDLGELIPLCGQLVETLLANRNDALSPQEKANIAFTPTDSLSALEHFYNGVHAYDQGDYAEASGEFLAATQQDPHYLDARLWFARMMEQMGRDDEAIGAYLALYAKAPESVEGIDSRYFAARLQAKSQPDEAIRNFQALAALRPEMPETMEAAHQAAQLYRRRGDVEKAYLLDRQIDDFSAHVRNHVNAYSAKWSLEDKTSAATLRNIWNQLTDSARSGKTEDPEHRDVRYIANPTRHSRFFAWPHALGLYREAITDMVELYRDLPPNAADGAPYPPPRGSFVVDPANPVIGGDVKEKDKSLFGGDHTYDARWKETFFALIVPKGYAATGIDLEITGRLPEPTTSRDFTLRVLPFPLPQNYQNGWLGVIYGQTPTTSTLAKDVPFYGNDQRLLALQLIENYGEIDHWQVHVRLRKDDAPAAPSATYTAAPDAEGAVRATVRLGDARTFESMPQYVMHAQPNQKLALTADGDNHLWLVGVKGELWADDTDLWLARSDDGGRHWTTAEPMNVNSASDEFAPSLIHAEDGTLHLFFLSNRRGLGWELWTSMQDKVSKRWAHPTLVPIRDFVATGLENDNAAPQNLLPYAVMQDSHGQWLVATGSRATHQLVILASDDLTGWRMQTALPDETVAAVGLGQDSSDRYYMVSITQSGVSQIRVSNDAKNWTAASATRGKLYDPHFPLTLLKRRGEGMMLLFSDKTTGLQYAPIAPSLPFQPDLVTASGLEPYAATATPDGALVALWKNDDIFIQHYQRFAFAENGVNNPNEIIYTERSRDKTGGVWDRIFARERYRVPDVTAVGAASEGRVWWGIETGIMSLKGADFLVSDVSEGFFFHAVDLIKHCGDTTWFAARNLNAPLVGYSVGRRLDAGSVGKPLRLDELSGAVASIACDAKGATYFADSHGNILFAPQDAARQSFMLPRHGTEGSAATLVFDNANDRLLAGTLDGDLYAMSRKGAFVKLGHFNHALRSLALDAKGHIWAAVENEGAKVLTTTGKLMKTYDPPAIPASLHKIVPAASGGVWAIADSHVPSPGLIRLDDHGVSFNNPPQKPLSGIVDFDVAEDGSVWIGTMLDGIYHYRNAP